jgi:UDP-N-acetyl-D-mannosaminuronic acid dehydrogenase
MEQRYDVCIVGGVGHIGLPLGIALAAAGRRVVLYDINRENVERVGRGEMPFKEEGAETVLREVLERTLFLSLDRESVTMSRFVVIVIGTPVDEHLNPQYTVFKRFLMDMMDVIRDDQHIILRSTVYPGTTEKVREILEENGKGARVSFCPERIAEGKAMEELRSLPQIVASFDQESFEEAAGLFRLLTDDIIELRPREAELTKLFTNVWRYIQFSISNQFYQLALQNDLDFYRIYDAATYNYPRTKGFAGAGFAAGPCLFKDTMQLAAYSNNSFFLGHAAMLINEGLPNVIVQRLKDRHSLGDKVVAILGMAFKGDSDDNRESLSYKLRKILDIEARRVLCTDPFVQDPTLVPLEEALESADIVIVGAPHSQYRGLADELENRILIDMWNFFGKGGLF